MLKFIAKLFRRKPKTAAPVPDMPSSYGLPGCGSLDTNRFRPMDDRPKSIRDAPSARPVVRLRDRNTIEIDEEIAAAFIGMYQRRNEQREDGQPVHRVESYPQRRDTPDSDE